MLTHKLSFYLAFALLAACFLLSGCASGKLFENRLMCTTDGTGAVVVSRWAGFGIASNLSDDDVRAVCKRQAESIK